LACDPQAQQLLFASHDAIFKPFMKNLQQSARFDGNYSLHEELLSDLPCHLLQQTVAYNPGLRPWL
jgi:hypothetical protein